MRVVAGSAGGIPLHAPRTDIRPTMDRVKAAIFSSLGDQVPGSRVLDLFAGTGSLGIEALSRGCESAVFVDKSMEAVDSIKRNLSKTGLTGTIHQMDVFSFLDRNKRAHSFDLIFADPPYAKAKGDRDFNPEILESEGLQSLLAIDGLLILEKMPRAKLTTKKWECIRVKKYGSTEVAFLRSNQPLKDPS